MPVANTDLIIFDCDGVLIESETIANQVCAEYVKELGLDITMQEFAARYAGTPVDFFWKKVAIDTGVIITTEFKQRVDDEVHRRFATDLQEMNGTSYLLSQVSSRKCVASSTALPSLVKNLKQVRLDHHFLDAIFSASQVARGKPSPDVFLFAASQMGADPANCLVIEDSVPGVTAAGRAGMRVIGFTGGGHTLQGHDVKLEKAGAFAIATSMSELGNLLNT